MSENTMIEVARFMFYYWLSGAIFNYVLLSTTIFVGSILKKRKKKTSLPVLIFNCATKKILGSTLFVKSIMRGWRGTPGLISGAVYMLREEI